MPSLKVKRHDVNLLPIFKHLRNLENLLKCDSCQTLPHLVGDDAPVFLMKDCLHRFCYDCGQKSEFCLVPGCIMLVLEKTKEKDLMLTKRVTSLWKLRAALKIPEELEQGCSEQDETPIQAANNGTLAAEETCTSEDVRHLVKGTRRRNSNGRMTQCKDSIKSSNSSASVSNEKMKKRMSTQAKKAVIVLTPLDNRENKKRSSTGKKIAKGRKSASLPKSSVAKKEDSSKPGGPTTTPHNLDKKNKRGETHLQVACIKGKNGDVQRLLELGANPNTQDNAGWTPLHEAAQRNFRSIVELLLANGANPNIPGGEENLTPLHDAVIAGAVEIVQLLIQHGASKVCRDLSGLTPIDYARSEVLKNVIADTDCTLTETEQLNQSVRQSEPSSRTVVITPSPNIDHSKVEELKSFVKKFHCKLEQSLTPQTTHLIVPSSDENITKDSPVYYKALMLGKWIVRWDWVEESQESNTLMDEDDFVVLGTRHHRQGAPAKSVANSLKQLPGLFKGFNIYLHGSFTPPYPSAPEIASILKCGGANVLTREPDPEFIPSKERTVAFHASPEISLAKCSHLILYQEGGPREPELKYNMSHVKSLPAAWLFECINNFEIIEAFH